MAALARLAILLAVMAGGCDYFRPAVPERPTRPPLPVDYSHPDRTLATMNIGLADKSTQGLDAYMGALAESTSTSTPAFHQLFWPEDMTAWGGDPPDDWNTSLERGLYGYLVQLRQLDAYELLWTPVGTDDIDDAGGRATLERHYRTIAITADNDTLTVAIGYADLKFQRDVQDRWLITLWTDKADPEADESNDEISLGRHRLQSLSGQ